MSKAKGKNTKVAKKNQHANERKQAVLKVVLSNTCEVCKTPCARGMRYLENMKQPGAVGKGVPCILTRTYV